MRASVPKASSAKLSARASHCLWGSWLPPQSPASWPGSWPRSPPDQHHCLHLCGTGSSWEARGPPGPGCHPPRPRRSHPTVGDQRSDFHSPGRRVEGGCERVNLTLAVIPFWHLRVNLIGSQLSCCLSSETETRPQGGLDMVNWPCLLVGSRASSETAPGDDCWRRPCWVPLAPG